MRHAQLAQGQPRAAPQFSDWHRYTPTPPPAPTARDLGSHLLTLEEAGCLGKEGSPADRVSPPSV